MQFAAEISQVSSVLGELNIVTSRACIRLALGRGWREQEDTESSDSKDKNCSWGQRQREQELLLSPKLLEGCYKG